MDLDLGLLILRLALGPMLVAHGWNKARGAGGFAGTAAWFEGLGLRPGWLHARLAAATELGAGALMTLGLLTGLAATAFVGLMLVAALTDHRGKGYFVFKGGCEYTALIAISAVGIAATGPGAWSADHAASLTVSGGAWALIAVLGGGICALLLLAVARRPA
ncbi:DoxX family protein [Nocardioides sp. BP30]|uniref:DoxX family protein n=1 Tax=Nocardioides sp. BP30 TaxID=3036374 RepID=UPI002469614D|nr:DoxX family protein [Nocardioides sp. BP30]WGL54047.1 DoxX family protein [Nocardioides sp. BP30]